MKVRLALEKIAALENLAPSDEEVEAEFKKYADQYSMEIEKIKSLIPDASIRGDLAVSKAMDLVKANAVAPAKAKAKKED